MIANTARMLESYVDSQSYTLETQNLTLIKPLIHHFNTDNTWLIQSLLLSHGLFQPEVTDAQMISKFIKADCSKLVDEHFLKLKEEWHGTDPAIFIFPMSQLTESTPHVSGLSFFDKIFLFIDHDVQEKKILAILAHEYSHVVRLNRLSQTEDTITLGDTIILEGIAEEITQEKYNISLLDSSMPKSIALDNVWQKWIKPNLSLPSSNPLQHHIMYGNDQIPKLAGYHIGTDIVKQWQQKQQMNLIDLLQTPTEQFFKEIKYETSIELSE